MSNFMISITVCNYVKLIKHEDFLSKLYQAIKLQSGCVTEVSVVLIKISTSVSSMNSFCPDSGFFNSYVILMLHPWDLLIIFWNI